MNTMKKFLALAIAALAMHGLTAKPSGQDDLVLRSGKHLRDRDHKDFHNKDRHCKPVNDFHKDRLNCLDNCEVLKIGIFDNDLPWSNIRDDRTAEGFDVLLWCQLCECLNRKCEFIRIQRGESALRLLESQQIHVVGTSVGRTIWNQAKVRRHANVIISYNCSTQESTQSVIWDSAVLPKTATSKLTDGDILKNLWQIDNLVFGTTAEGTTHYNGLRVAAIAAGRSEEYFESHVITDTAQYLEDPIQLLAHFGPMNASDKYQVLYADQTLDPNLARTLKTLQVYPSVYGASDELDVSRSTIQSIEIPAMIDSPRGYLLSKDCCQLARDVQECLNSIICDGTYHQICLLIQEIRPAFQCCTPALYESFARGTVSRRCICCTFPNKPCDKRNPCDIPCNPKVKKSLPTPQPPAE